MKRDAIDALLQLAFLEAAITTHGLYERTVARKKPLATAASAARAVLQRRLETVLQRRGIEEVPLTVGVFLRKCRSEKSLRPAQIFARLGLSANIYKMLEHDRISPLKIPVESWKKLRQLFNLSASVLIEMIRRTHQLFWFRPSFRTTLARYDVRKNKAMKASTLEMAARELYTRAALTLPAEEEKKLTALFQALSKES